MKPSCHKYAYPLDLDRIARDVASRRIDIAPTRLAWERLAQCCATIEGEQGRDAFHLMAAVWPDYNRHDSELCYNRALRQTGRAVSIGYLAWALKRHGIDINHHRYRKAGKPQIVKTNKTNQQNTSTMKKIPLNTMLNTLANQRSLLGLNPLTDLLLRLFPQSRVIKAVERYYVGFNAFNTRKTGDALIYWQLDASKKIINAKKMYYKSDGHRDKKLPPMVMYPGNPQCLFGLHLLTEADPDTPVAIVESEKSALIMSIARPEYLWMACGSLNNFNEKFLEPLRQRLIIGFPDVDIQRDKQSGVSTSCALWGKTAKQMRLKGWRIIIDSQLERTANTSQRMDKIDIADIALDNAKQQHYKSLLRVRADETDETNKTNKTN